MPQHKKNILIVDDDSSIRAILDNILSHRGYNCNLACNGEEGLELLVNNHKKIDLVISDLYMPKIDGEEFLKLSKIQGIDTPFLFLSQQHAQPSLHPLEGEAVEEAVEAE